MMIQGLRKTFQVGDREVTVRELRADEVRAVLAELEQPAELPEVLVMHHLMLESADERLVLRLWEQLIDLPFAELAPLEGSVVQQLCRAAIEVNAGFFHRALPRLRRAAELAVPDNPAASSSVP